MASPPSLARNESQTSRRSASLGSRLFRSKSGEGLGDRKSSSGRPKKKHSEMEDPVKVNQSPPRLPDIPQPSGLQSFGGENYNPHAVTSEYANSSSDVPPVPPLPEQKEKEVVDPYARTESMTHRKWTWTDSPDGIASLTV